MLSELPEKTETTLSIAFDEAEETMYMANLAQVNKELQQELDLGEDQSVPGFGNADALTADLS